MVQVQEEEVVGHIQAKVEADQDLMVVVEWDVEDQDQMVEVEWDVVDHLLVIQIIEVHHQKEEDI